MEKSSILDGLEWLNLKCFILRSPAVWPMFSYEIDLACALNHAGSDVTISTCHGAPKGCGANSIFPTAFERSICAECKSTQRTAIKWTKSEKLSISQIEFDRLAAPFSTSFESFCAIILPKICSNTILHEYFTGRLGPNWVVEAAYSSLMSFTNNPIPDPQRYQKIYAKFLFDSYNSTLNSRELMHSYDFDKFFIFNGRTSLYRPLLRELQHCGRKEDLYVYEHPFSGGDNDKDRYLISHQNYHHDLHNFSKQLRKQFNTSDSDKRTWYYEGNKWFEDRIYSNTHAYKKHVTKYQKDGLLPVQWKSHKFNIIFFASTEAEWAGIPEISKQRPFQTQADAILWFSKEIPQDCDFYIRMHPSNTSETRTLQHTITESAMDKSFVIPGDSSIDSYAIAKAADLVITFGSTISVEAAWLGTRVLTLGPSAYSAFSVGHTVMTKMALRKFLNELSNYEKPDREQCRENACKYVYTLKHCEHPKNYNLGSNTVSVDYLVPNEFTPNLFIKMLVRTILLPMNIKKAVFYLKSGGFSKMTYNQKLKLIEKFFWKPTP